MATELVLNGIGVSPGVVVGPVSVVAAHEPVIPEREIPADAVEHEIVRLEDALIETRRQLRGIQRSLETHTAVSDASILDAHLMVLDDRMFIEEIVREIKEKRRNVEAAVTNVASRYTAVLASMKDGYLRERVSDIRDVARRVVRNLCGDEESVVTQVPHEHIVVAPDLAPSETATLRKEIVVGFATDYGSSTSHTAVMARALGIPAVVALRDVTRRVTTGDTLLVDGYKGVLIVNPTKQHLDEYGEVAEVRRNIEQGLTRLKDQPAETTDGVRIVLSANTEGLEEVGAVLKHGAEGVGLFRSEYLHLAKNEMVSEEEQAAVYRKIATSLAPAPVIIRTLDLGGDKFFTDGGFIREANPFLGCRSIRFSLLHPDLFTSQLRAILRASDGGNVKVMYPMISNADEVLLANQLLESAKAELHDEGVPFDADIEVGVMIEIPSAALTADIIAEHVRFFSLGTNDLIQYTMAVDRVNEKVAYLYQPTHPAVLRLIKETIDAGHRHGIWVGLCGEMAGDPILTPLLLGLGVDELSVAPLLVPLVKDAVRSVKIERCRALAEQALQCDTAEKVLGLCRSLTAEIAPELLELT